MTAFVKYFSIVILVTLSTIVGVNAVAEVNGCGTQTLRGAYMYSADGFLTASPGQGPFTPVSEAGVYIFDGAGKFTTKNTISIGGQIIPRTAAGTYTVNADCTGSVNVEGGAAFDFATSRSGQEMRFVVTTPTVSVTGTMKPQ